MILSEKERAHRAILSEKDRVLSEKERVLSENERVLSENERAHRAERELDQMRIAQLQTELLDARGR